MEKKTLAPVGGARLIGFGLQHWLAIVVSFTLMLACAFLPAPPPTASAPTAPPTASTPLAANASATAPTPTESALTMPSAWGQVLDQIQPDGTVTADTALQAFSLAFGPLPGVTVSSGPVGEIRSGTMALRWLVGHWSEITPAQRAAAVQLL